MKRATAVIGSSFGDEGKGLMTDYFCRKSKEKPLVIRFNGGAQAGHTVVTPEGLRHVFSHIGSGFFAGADTFLSKHFLVNPVLYLKECKALKTFPTVFVDSRAPVTTIYDMFVNQKIEESRGLQRHGSCGMGIHETMLRQQSPYANFTAGNIYDIVNREAMCRNYSFMRLESLGLLTDEVRTWFANSKISDEFMQDCLNFARKVKIVDDLSDIVAYKDVVFEGAQGLLLDQNNKQFFPHVTCSNTGLTNVIDIAQELGINSIDAVYVARSYLTRHGAGPLPGEDENLSYEDDTNVNNAWQGSLRFAPQDWRLVHTTIFNDLIRNKSDEVTVIPQIAITHQDQCQRGPTKPEIEIMLRYESYGPTWCDVRDLKIPKQESAELRDDAFLSHV